MPAAITLKAPVARDVPTIAVRSPASLAGHLVEAVRAWRRARLEQEVGHFIARNGGRLTDDLERQIGRRFG